MPRDLAVGIVGRRGMAFLAGLRSFPEVAVVAFCDLNPAVLHALADRFEIPERYVHYEDLLARDLDVVIVATPMPLHVPQSVAALERGKHVLCEVTAATSLEECRQLVAAVRRSGRKYMLAENYCYTRAAMLIQAMVRRGLFGELYYAEGAYIHNCSHLYYDARGQPTWRGRLLVRRNGCVYCTHSLGPVLQWLDDRVVSVACVGSGVHTLPQHALEDTVVMLCRTARGALITITLDIQSRRPHNMTHYVLQGTKGAYHAARRPGEPDLVWLADRSPGPEAWQTLEEYAAEFLPPEWRAFGHLAAQAGHGGGDFFVARAFIAAVLADTDPPIAVYRALDFTIPGLVSEESIRHGGLPLPVPDPRQF